ncbi:cysteine-rich venom protein 6-like [Sergentomyia squamirostris]
MKWYLVKIFLVTSVLVICVCGEVPSDESESLTEHDDDEEFYNGDDQRKHSHNSGIYYKPIYVATTPKYPTTTTTEKGLVPLPNPNPISCPRYEEYHDCGSPCQVQCDNLGQVCNIQNVRCSDGCYCIPGYARNFPNGPCIPQYKCPEPYCSANEVWLDCYQAPACDRECTRLDKPCEAVGSKCNAGCFCKRGYARHPMTNNCVPQSQCPVKEPQCSSYEEFQTCGFRCSEDCDDNKCLVEKRPCEKGCFCKSGYARIDGVCKPKNKCPTTCPTHEVFIDCGSVCQDNCEQNQACTEQCVRGCFCEPGYARIDGVCVPRDKCPNNCPNNEEFLDCGSACQDNCNQNQPCTDQCIRGCFCKSGYARIDGICVPRKKCSTECPLNEHYDSCGNTCNDRCDRDRILCIAECIPGCYCNEGYARISGKCVPRNKCNQCSKNEEYLTCGNNCQDLCNAAAVQCIDSCVEGCFCKSGYARVNGICVPRSKCYTCGSGEEYTNCGNPCFERCDRNVIFCPYACEEGCFCASGFSRIEGQCLPDELCPTCGENEEYSDCGNGCLERCGANLCPIDIACTKGCYCKPGYKRLEGSCVPEGKCPPQCTGPNEVYADCGNNCTDLCPDPNRFCTLECYNGCFCAEGYSRADYNSPCMPTDQCSCSRPNEEYSDCGNNCTELCPRPGRACEKNCWKGCFCKKGYYRPRYSADCIPQYKCPPPPVCTDPNEEVSDCGNSCNDYCPGPNYNCPIDCQIGCYCKAGYKRITPDGPCVGESQCSVVCTNVNEEYTDCGNPCSELCPGSEIVCPAVCYTGCYCKPGYSRINGECVPTSQCPPTCTNPLEVYKNCSNACAESCNTAGNPCPLYCKSGCYCRDGYSRSNGVCIQTSECPGKCPDPNEIYSECGSSCKERCGADACPEICETGCFCRPGYSRVNGVCIPTKKCPVCGVNEEYSYCASGCTDPCELREAQCKDVCREGCYCRDGYSRITPNSTCVPDSQCPSTGTTCGKYEVWTDCGRDCQTQCDNMGARCPIVHIICPSGCYCEPGYARIYEGGCCVEQSICPSSPCGDNEIWLECGDPPQPIPCPQNCDDIGSSCIEQYPTCDTTVPGGCYCKPGYARAPNSSRCIPIDSCNPKSPKRKVSKPQRPGLNKN